MEGRVSQHQVEAPLVRLEQAVADPLLDAHGAAGPEAAGLGIEIDAHQPGRGQREDRAGRVQEHALAAGRVDDPRVRCGSQRRREADEELDEEARDLGRGEELSALLAAVGGRSRSRHALRLLRGAPPIEVTGAAGHHCRDE